MSHVARTFVALPISRRTAQALFDLRRRFPAQIARIRWVPPHQHHITLRFLGDVERSRIPALIEAVRSSVEGRGSLTLSFQGVGAFPGWKDPRVLWCGVAEGEAALVEVASAVRAALAPLAPGEDEKPFRPHVTLGRIKEAPARERLSEAAKECCDLRVGPESIERVVVYESRLAPQGAVHLELASVKL